MSGFERPVALPRNNAPAKLGQHREIELDFSLVDVIGVKHAPDPAQQMPVLGVFGVGNSFEEFKEPRDAANIFRRRTSGAIDKYRIIGVGVSVSDVFNHDAAPPVVAKVVNIRKAVNAAYN